MNKSNIPIDPNQISLAQKIASDGATSEGYTYEEKLAAVAAGNMAPEEVGLPSAQAAQEQLKPKKAELGTSIHFAAGVVPLELRAEWAYQETTIVLDPKAKTEWIESWIDQNKKSYRIQGTVQCGTAGMKFERTFRDPILGLTAMLKLCGDMIESKYLGTEMPPLTDQPQKQENQDGPTNQD